ncbi:MAG TPA: hypothetical protein VFW21_11240 [Mycobacterium sp.]|nr:hypothetical protein [Mycobacterium sp.]
MTGLCAAALTIAGLMVGAPAAYADDPVSLPQVGDIGVFLLRAPANTLTGSAETGLVAGPDGNLWSAAGADILVFSPTSQSLVATYPVGEVVGDTDATIGDLISGPDQSVRRCPRQGAAVARRRW